MVKMKDLTNSNFWMWDRNKFINRKYKMQEMYQNFIDGMFIIESYFVKFQISLRLTLHPPTSTLPPPPRGC